jgi:hypothetical protein
MSDNFPAIRAVYAERFPGIANMSDARFLREPIGSTKFGDPSSVRDAIDAVAERFATTFSVAELADLVTIQSLVDLVDDHVN